MYKFLYEFLSRYTFIIKYGISGVIGILTNLAVLFFLTDLVELWYALSAVVAYTVSFIVAFTLQKYWTFNDMNHHSIPRQAMSYLIIATFALIFDISALYILVDIFGFWYLGSQVVVLGIIAVVSFLLNKNITFKNSHKMRLQEVPFRQIKDGTKTIETRLFDEKRKKIRVGDTIEFTLIDDPEQILIVKVVKLIKKDKFSDLFDLYSPEKFGGKSKEDLMKIYNYYNFDDEQKLGVVGIVLERIL